MKLPDWLVPSRAARVLFLYLPLMTVATLFALRVAGIGYEDLQAYVLEAAPRSVYAIAILGITEAFMRLRGMDTSNAERCRLQALMSDSNVTPARRAFAYKALMLENVTSVAVLLIVALIFLVWQG